MHEDLLYFLKDSPVFSTSKSKSKQLGCKPLITVTKNPPITASCTYLPQTWKRYTYCYMANLMISPLGNWSKFCLPSATLKLVPQKKFLCLRLCHEHFRKKSLINNDNWCFNLANSCPRLHEPDSLRYIHIVTTFLSIQNFTEHLPDTDYNL